MLNRCSQSRSSEVRFESQQLPGNLTTIEHVEGQTFEITPLVGFRYGGDFRLQPGERDSYSIAALSNSASYGFQSVIGWTRSP